MRNPSFRLIGVFCILGLQVFWGPTRAATVSWVGGSGDWTNAANWSTGALPGTNDDVVISVSSAITVTHSAGTHTVKSVKSQEAFVLSGGALKVTTTFLASNTVTLYGGSLQSATLTTTNGASVIVEGGSSVLNGVTLVGTLDVGNTYNVAGVTITNGLVLNGTALVGNPTNSYDGELVFAGTQTLSGGGTVVFGNNGNFSYNALQLSTAGTTLTIGPGITIEGQNGVIGYANGWGGPSNVTVVNQGTIAETVNNGMIGVVGSFLLNQGRMSAVVGGGAIDLSAVLTNTGTINLINANNSTLTLGGNTGTINVTNSALTLAGAFTLANLGAFHAGQTTVYLTGTFTNNTTTLAVNALGGSWVLNGGTIMGGTVTATNGASLIVEGRSGILNGVTMDGTLDVGNSYGGCGVTVTNGLVLNGTMLVGNPTSGGYGGVFFAGTQTLGGNGTVVFGNCGTYSYNALWLSNAGTTLTIGPGITIEGQTGVIGYGYAWSGPQNVNVINQGTIAETISGGTISVAGGFFLNQGTMSAVVGAGALNVSALLTNTGTINVLGANNTTLTVGANTGTINVTNSTLTLAGAFTLANLGAFHAGQTMVYLTGTFTNNTTTLAVNALGGSWVLNGGTIIGGTVTATNGAALIVEGRSGILNGVTMNGTLDVGNSYGGCGVTVTNGLVLNGTMLVGNPTNGGYGGVFFAGTQTLGGNGTVVFGNCGSYSYNALWLSNAGTTLTIGPGITIEGQNGVIGYGYAWSGPQNVNVINQGTIAESISGGTISVAGSFFLNQGTMSAVVGGGALNVSAVLTNTGTIYLLNANNSTLTLGGNTGTINVTNSTLTLAGAFTLANLGAFHAGQTTVYLTGTFTNSTTTLAVNALGGSWVLNGGTIIGGTVTATNGAALIVEGRSGILNGVTMNGTLDVGNSYGGCGVTVTNGLVLNGTMLVGNPTNGGYGGVFFAGTQTLGGNGTVVFGNCGSYSYNALWLSNAGTTLTIGPGITIEGQTGVIGYGYAWSGPQNVNVINQGKISANVSGGTISVVPQTFTNQGSVSADPGYIALNSGFAPASGSLTVGLSNSISYGQIQFSGSETLGGTFNVVLLGGFVPAISNAFTVVTYGSETGTFSPLNLPVSPTWQANYGSTALTLLVADINKLALTSAPFNTNAGSILSPVVVQVVDSATGNSVAKNGVAVTVSLASGTGILSGTLTRNTDSTGKATFNDLSLNLAGSKTLLATAIAANVTPVTSGSFSITAGAPTQLALASAIASPQQNGIAFTPAVAVQVLDQFGNVVSNSAAAITASSSSTGTGILAGTIGANANGTTGTATFGNLQYDLGKTNTAESVVIHFASPGLTSVASQTVLVDYVFRPFTLTNGNSVVQIDPTTQNGVSAWIVDGVDNLFQKWYWLAEWSYVPASLDTWSSPVGMASVSNNSAMVIYSAQGLQVKLGFSLTGGQPGSRVSTLNENIAITNTSYSSITLHVYQYSDIDLDGQSAGDSISFPTSNSVLQSGKGLQLTETIQAPPPSEWETSWYAITFDELTGSSPVTLSDSIIGSGPGDQTFAFQWDNTLAAGQGFAISTTSFLQPPLNALSLAFSGTNAVISWPTNFSTTAQLQSCTNLAGGVWNNVTNASPVVNGSYQVTVPHSAKGSIFYRLH